MTNLWMEMLMHALESYVEEIRDKSEYFDFMTLFKRVVTHPLLTNFDFIIKQHHDVLEATEDVDKWHGHADTLMAIAKVVSAMKEMGEPTTLDDLRQSTYTLRDIPEYTYMEFYWIYIAWIAFGDETLVPVPHLAHVLRQMRENIKEDPNFDSQTLVAKIVGTPTHGVQEQVDVLKHMLQRMDQNLTTMWEMEKIGGGIGKTRRAIRDLH
jgi:hypothetical protein